MMFVVTSGCTSDLLVGTPHISHESRADGGSDHTIIKILVQKRLALIMILIEVYSHRSNVSDQAGDGDHAGAEGVSGIKAGDGIYTK